MPTTAQQKACWPRELAWPTDLAALLEFRLRAGRPVSAGTPTAVLQAVQGVDVEMFIEGVMPRAHCFLQVAPAYSSLLS